MIKCIKSGKAKLSAGGSIQKISTAFGKAVPPICGRRLVHLSVAY
jgi:hypothetical protein